MKGDEFERVSTKEEFLEVAAEMGVDKERAEKLWDMPEREMAFASRGGSISKGALKIGFAALKAKKVGSLSDMVRAGKEAGVNVGPVAHLMEGDKKKEECLTAAQIISGMADDVQLKNAFNESIREGMIDIKAFFSFLELHPPTETATPELTRELCGCFGYKDVCMKEWLEQSDGTRSIVQLVIAILKDIPEFRKCRNACPQYNAIDVMPIENEHENTIH